MMSRPRFGAPPALAVPALALLVAGAVGLTACSSGSAGSAARSTTSTPSATATTAAVGRAVAPATLAGLMQRGLSTATSAHLAVSTVLAGQSLTGSGDIALTRGAISQADLQQDLPVGLGAVRIVVVGRTTYAKLPGALAPDASRPWVRLAAGSKSTVVSQLASVVQPLLTVAAPAGLVTFARSASSATDLGPGTVDGVATTHYRLVVDAASLPSDSGVTAGGRATIPIDLQLDAAGRPRQVSGTFTIRGQTVTPTITLSDYNAPVSVSAPPPGQVGTG